MIPPRDDYFAGYQYGREVGHREVAIVLIVIGAISLFVFATFFPFCRP